MMESGLNKNNLSFIVKLVVILLSFCVFNTSVKAGNLSSLKVVGYENDLTPTFDANTYEYSINIPNEEIDLIFNYTKENASDEVIVTNNLRLINTTGTAVINVSGTEYRINYTKVDGSIYNENFAYSGNYNSYTN